MSAVSSMSRRDASAAEDTAVGEAEAATGEDEAATAADEETTIEEEDTENPIIPQENFLDVTRHALACSSARVDLDQAISPDRLQERRADGATPSSREGRNRIE